MTRLTDLRVQALRNAKGTLLRWHPDDRDAADEVLERPLLTIVTLYDVVDRRHISDGDIVATLSVWPHTGEIEELALEEDCRRSRVPLEDMRADLQRHAIGGAA